MTASEWHFKFFRSWKFIVLVVCVLLTVPSEILSFRIGSLALQSAEYVEAPLQLAQEEAREAKERAVNIVGSVEERRAAYAEYNSMSRAANKLWLGMHALSIYGWTARVAAIGTMLIAVCAVLVLMGNRMAAFAMQPIYILLKIKLFAMYVQCIGFALGLAGFSDVFDIVRSASAQAGWDVLAVLAYLMPIVLIFYIVILRNVYRIVDDVAKVMRSDKYPGAFGHVCGLSWQPWVLTGMCMVAFLVVLLDLIYAASTGYGAAFADLMRLILSTDGKVTLMLAYVLLWLLLSAAKYGFLALLYPEYIRISQEMKGCAADVVKDNTPEYATPVYYRRK